MLVCFEYVNVFAVVLRCGITGKLDFDPEASRVMPNFCVFHRNETNQPSIEKAAWALELVRTSNLCEEPSALNFALSRRVFRADIYAKAAQRRSNIALEPENELQNQLISA